MESACGLGRIKLYNYTGREERRGNQYLVMEWKRVKNWN